jgi:hypothetical protein
VVLESVVDPAGVTLAVHVVSSTLDQTNEWGRKLQASAVAQVRGTRYQSTKVEGVGTYVCVPTTVRFTSR